jgi:hypothetical protein
VSRDKSWHFFNNMVVVASIRKYLLRHSPALP